MVWKEGTESRECVGESSSCKGHQAETMNIVYLYPSAHAGAAGESGVSGINRSWESFMSLDEYF